MAGGRCRWFKNRGNKFARMFLAIANAYLAESEVMSSYKEQSEIECSLRTVESFPEILPVYHVKSEKMRTHVFVRSLSHLLHQGSRCENREEDICKIWFSFIFESYPIVL